MTAQTSPSQRPSVAWSDLRIRVLSGLALAAIAIAAALIGGWTFTIVAAGLAALVAGEWIGITRGPRTLEIGLAAGGSCAAVVLSHLVDPVWAVGLVLIVATLIAFWLRSGWPAMSPIYAAGLGIALVLIRADPADGLRALGFIAAIVWGTDIAAYFAGRLIGGPKLWPAVSPKKTWSGAIGGAAAAVIAGIVFVAATGGTVSLTLTAVALLLSVVAQMGDLFESAVKRRFGVKDASRLIPGHGGFMDRVDGLTFAAIAAAFVGWIHAGGPALGTGLLLW